MLKQIYSCDLCKAEVGNSKQLLKIELKVGDISVASTLAMHVLKRYGKNEIHSFNGWSKDLCFECASKAGLVFESEKRPVHNDDSYGDQLYDIIINMISDAGG